MKQGSPFVKKQGTLVALACAAALAAPQAMAQVASPDFGSGKGLTLSVDFLLALASKGVSGTTAGAASDTVRRTELSSSSSSVYIKGSEKLGGSFLQGWGFVITWDFDPDEYNRRGANEVSTTVIGVQTPAGNFFLGVMDNPFKQIGSMNVATTSTFGSGLSQSAVLGNPGFRSGTAKGTSCGDAEGACPGNITRTMSFYRLNSNSVNWYSPDWNGFRGYAQYVPGDTDIPAGATEKDTYAYSAGVTYNNGPFNIGYVYEKHNDYLWGNAMGANQFGIGSTASVTGNALATHSSDNGQVLTAAYQFGNFKLGGFYQKLEYSQSASRDPATGLVPTVNLTDLSVNLWYLGVRWRSGPHEIGVMYSQSDDYECSGPVASACRTGDTGMKTYGIGYRYSVSKQLRLFASASRLSNDRFADYAGHSSAPTVGVGGTLNPTGGEVTNFSVGMTGSF